MNLPAETLSKRAKACLACTQPCRKYRTLARAFVLEPRARCKLGRWPSPPLGLGDAIAVVAEPIARASDALLGTQLVGCGGCSARRDALNAIVPDITKPMG